MNLLMFNLAVNREHVTLAFAITWIEDLAKQFDHVDVVTMTKGSYDVPENVRVWSLGKERGYPEWVRLIRFYWIVGNILRKRHIDVTFTHMIPIFAVLFWPLAKVRRIKNVMWYAHGATPMSLKIAHILVDSVVTSTPEGFRLPSNKVTYLGQAISESVFHSDVRTNSDRLRLITVGRLASSKGLNLMLDALALYPDDQRPSLTIVGGATNAEEERHSHMLRQIARGAGLEGYITFLGRRDESEVADLLRDHDVFLNLSETGSLDKAMVEAMACQCMVVSTNAAFASIAKKEGFEWCVPTERSAAALKDRLGALALKSPSDRHAIASLQAKIARRDHGRARFMERLTSVLMNGAQER